MTSRVLIRRHDVSMSLARSCLSAVLLLSTAAWPQSAASSSAGKSAAAALKRDSIRCRADAMWMPVTTPFVGIPAIPHFWFYWGMHSTMRTVRRTPFATIAAPRPWHRPRADSPPKSARPRPSWPDAEQDINPVIQQPQAGAIRMPLRRRSRIDEACVSNLGEPPALAA